MRTGRPKQPLTLTTEERDRLESIAHRARSQPLLARRARVVLASADGLDNQAVAKKLRCSKGMVGKWRARFLKSRLDGLFDEPDRERRARSATTRSNRSSLKPWRVRRAARRTGAHENWPRRAV
jgi:transposase